LANTLAVPLQPVRTFGKNGDGWHNMLIFGNNLRTKKASRCQFRNGAGF
jgi:site-specific DNA-methyltransferase (adenine-specific)/adenine-specific DNA-methyltransferase